MVFSRFVEVGRVAVVTYGPDAGKPVVIVDIIDQSRVLVDGPLFGVKRQPLTFRRLHLTNFVVKVPRSVGTASLAKALKKDSFEEKWATSPWAKKQDVRAKRAALTDFDRFKLMLAKKQSRVVVYREAKKLKKAAAK